MGYYTLLADENSPLANEESRRSDFRAHVIYNVILNGSLTFSDNQVVSSANLRWLARRDGVIREMFKQGMFSLALRKGFRQDGAESLQTVYQAFVDEGKIRGKLAQPGTHDELDFIESTAQKITWTFDDVRNQFTSSAEKMVLCEFRDRLNDAQYAQLIQVIAEEKERDRGGLGRAFIQNADRLPLVMERCGFMSAREARPLLIECSDAVYLSNLPKTMGLNPIYAHEHKKSFEKFRDLEYKFEPAGDPKPLKDRLSWDYFQKGLNQLDIDDINYIHERDEYRDFAELSTSADVIDVFDTLQIVFAELNMVIEDRIIQRFPELARTSPAPAPRQLQAKYGTRVSRGTTVISDLLSLGIKYAGASVPFIPFSGLLSDMVMDAVKAKYIPDRPHFNAASRHREMTRLRDYLVEKGTADVIQFDEEYTTSSSFEKEIIIG